MNPNDKHEVLTATLELMAEENDDVLSYYIRNDNVREFVVSELIELGFNVINYNERRNIYVDLKENDCYF